jgi:hypothetical protein
MRGELRITARLLPWAGLLALFSQWAFSRRRSLWLDKLIELSERSNKMGGP